MRWWRRRRLVPKPRNYTRLNDGMQTKKKELCILKQLGRQRKCETSPLNLFVLRPTERPRRRHFILLNYTLCYVWMEQKWGRMAPIMLSFSLLPAQQLLPLRAKRNDRKIFRLCEIIMLRWGAGLWTGPAIQIFRPGLLFIWPDPDHNQQGDYRKLFPIWWD